MGLGHPRITEVDLNLWVLAMECWGQGATWKYTATMASLDQPTPFTRVLLGETAHSTSAMVPVSLQDGLCVSGATFVIFTV
jgi:hypothetical protein